MTEKEIKELISKIRKAFSNTSYPGDKKIGIGDEWEYQKFIGKAWQELSLDTLFSDQFPHRFTAKGLQYYMPAYLIAILSSPSDWRSQSLAKEIVRSLTPDSTVDLQQRPKTPFTRRQLLVILHFIVAYRTFLKEDEGIQETINRCLTFWKGFNLS